MTAPRPPVVTQHRRWLPRVRYSLRTLLCFVLLIGSAMTLWRQWEPWVLDREIGGVDAIDIAPDRRHLLVWHYWHENELWDALDWRQKWIATKLPKDFKHHNMYFDRSQSSCSIVQQLDDDITYFDLNTGQVLKHFTVPHDAYYSGTLIHGCTQLLEQKAQRRKGMITYGENPIRLYEAISHTLIAELRGFLDEHSTDERLLITWGTPEGRSPSPVTIWLYSLESGQLLHEFPLQHWVEEAGFLDNSTFYERNENSISVWDCNSTKCIGTFQHPVKRLDYVRSTPDHKFIVTSGGNETAIFSVASGTQIARFEGDLLRFSASLDSTRLLCRFGREPLMEDQHGIYYRHHEWRIVATDGTAYNLPHECKTANNLNFLTDDLIVGLSDTTLRRWHRNHPEYSWGVLWLSGFWLTLIFASTFVWSILRDRRDRSIGR